MKKLTVPGFRNKGCFDCMSTKNLLEHGAAMLANKWRVEYGTDGNGNTEYRWTSPRGDVYCSYAANVPHFRAVEDAVNHNDYECGIDQV